MSFLLKKVDLLGNQKTELSIAPATTNRNKDNATDTETVATPTSTPKLEIVFKDIVVDADDIVCDADNISNQQSADFNEAAAASGKSAADNSVDNNESTSTSKNDSSAIGHDLTIFRVSCTCVDCLKYREIIIQLFLEDLEYNALWERLQLLIRKFYDLVPDNKTNIMDQKYKAAMTKNVTKWSSDGLIDGKKNIQLSLGSNLPYSNEMTFILVFSMLYTRDPHQLFELLCIQMRCIAIAYSQGLKSIIKTSSESSQQQQPLYNPIDLLNFILDGYDKMCNAAKELTPLLFELQRGHLQKFSLTWNLLNKRVYQRWVYLEVQDLIPECILSLKELLDTEKYKAMVYRFIKFDDEMTLTTQMWRDVWSLIHDYHLNGDDIERRKRIVSVHSVLNSIKNTKFKLHDRDFEDPNHNIFEWLTVNDRNTVWNFTVYFLRNNWIGCTEQRLNATIANVQCLKCNFALASHYVDCTCRTCLIAGGPCFTKLKENTKQMCCTKCSFFEKLDRDYLDYVTKIINNKSEEANKKVRLVYEPKNIQTLSTPANVDPGIEWLRNHSYHLSWAVFKHLPSRQPYNTSNFNVEHFCSFQSTPCTMNECRVATHIIAGLYPLNFSKFLIKAYQPLVDDERKELMDIQNLYFTYLIQKLCDDNSKKINPVHAMDLLWNVDDSDYALLCDIGSAFAECYLTDTPIPIAETVESCFLADGYDIELNLYWLECIYMTKSSEHPSMVMSAKDGDLDYPKNSDVKDPKLNELKELRFQMDKLFLGKTAYKRRTLLKYDGVISPFGKVAENEKKTGSSSSSSSSSSVTTQATNITNAPAATASTTVPSTKDKGVQKAASKDDKDTKDEKTENSKGDHLAEALKLAVNQKLNLTLEAELRTLKKEHSVLKDMVKNLEQIKENEEKQIKTADKNGHQCCAEHSDLFDNHPNKMCHRGDGQCTCYYCTIFGHTECNHGRINETRDRLRKRLHHQIHNKDASKSTNTKTAKIAHGVIKKSSTTNEVKHLANALTAIKNGIPPQPAVPNNRLDSTGAAATKRKLYTPIANQTQNNLVTNNEQQQQQQQQQQQRPPQQPPPIEPQQQPPPQQQQQQQQRQDSQQSSATIGNDDSQRAAKKAFVTLLDKPNVGAKNKEPNLPTLPSFVERQLPYCKIEDILEFIEGSTSKKDSLKKAAKKAKQKQKKQDVKKIEELEQMRDEFHEIFFKESDAKSELKGLKTAKKKDKKKILEAENNVKKYGKTRAKFETSILELIADLKRNNAEFKFAYLPSKEQQQMKQQKDIATVQQQHSSQPAESSSNTTGNKKTGTKVDAVNPVSTKPVNVLINSQKQQNCEMWVDPSKRMVTIRRINVPHADPQVTVTAKGSSPDKDKLLYTFINGQLVIANPNETNTLKIGTSQLQQYQLQHQQLRQQNLAAQLNAGSTTTSGTTVAQSSVVELNTDENSMKAEGGKKSKKELKKQTSTDSLGNSKQPPIGGKSPSESISGANKTNGKERKGKTKDKQREKIAVKKQPEPEQQGKKIEKTANKNKANRSESPRETTVMPKTKNLSLNENVDEPEKKVGKRKVKAPKFEYADPQYKINKFDVLDMDDDDYYISDLESLSDDERTPVVSSVQANTKSSNENSKPTAALTTKRGSNKSNESFSLKSMPAAKVITKSDATAKSLKTQKLVNGENGQQITNLSNDISGVKKQKKPVVQTAAKQSEPSSSIPATKSAGKKSRVEKSVLKAEKMAKSLQSSMQRLHLNDDTTIELVNENHNQSTKQQINPGVSIMDQLNRGVKVEGLMLPPGITLTRVDPNTVSAVHAKKESIGRICHPMPANVVQEPTVQPHLIMSNPIMPPPMSINQDENGFIMVDTIGSVDKSYQQSKVTGGNDGNCKKNNKKNRRKNKNRKDTDTTTNTAPTNGSNIVTLRNPLFQGNNDPIRQLKQSARPQMPLNIDQPAAIIKNENGMFTIRNPALHQALSNNIATKNNIKQYIAEQGFGNPIVSQDNLSFFSDNTIPECNGVSSAKHTVAIGSEIKNVQQQLQQQQQQQQQKLQQQLQQQQQHLHQMAWTKDLNQQQQQQQRQINGDIFQMNHLNPQQTRSYSPFDPHLSYGFNSDFIGASSTTSCVPPQPHYYNSNGYGAYTNGLSTDCSNNSNSYFGTNPHRCDSPPLAVTNNYYDNIGQSYNNKKFDDMSFLHNLQPGQRLNSEVTIHNISESKFHRDQQSVPLTNGVEITRIPGPSPHQHQPHHHQQRCTAPNLAVGSQRKSTGRNGENIGEFGDNIFAPNQTVNLSELESEERDIESFKRFNYYFEPPKNKPKINFNVKDIVLTKKPSNSDRSSPYFSDPTSVNSTPTLDDLYQEMNALSLSNSCDMMQQRQINAQQQQQHHHQHPINIANPAAIDPTATTTTSVVGAMNNCSDENFMHNGLIENDLQSGLIE